MRREIWSDAQMMLASMRVQNYRSIRDATLCLDGLTALVGANGVGKSSLLRAISLFYDPAPSVSEGDYHARDASGPITLTATFTDLSGPARSRFGPYIQGESLVVERVVALRDGRTDAPYHGSRLRCKDFMGFWNQSAASAANAEYKKIRDKKEYSEFLPFAKYDERKAHLERWENDHPDRCMRVRDEGKFFGFKEVGAGYLGRFTRFLSIEAVHDASSDEREARGSALGDIMAMAVRANLDLTPLQDVQEEIVDRVRDVMDRGQIEDQISGLSSKLTDALHAYVPDGRIELDLERMPEVSLELPRAAARLVEDDYKTDVQGAGHGLQRAFIMAVLSYLADAKGRPAPGDGDGQPAPCLVLCIEESELYQHPNRQRHMAEALLRLAKKGGGEERGPTQVVYATHSPHFVGIDRIDQLRLIKKEESGGGEGAPRTVVRQTSLESVAKELAAKAKASGTALKRTFTAETLAARLQAVMTPWMNEGFFAGAVVLVEGEADRAVITGYLSARGSRADSMDISVIPCDGKASIDRPALIFQSLGIPVYAVWDCDGNKKPAERGESSNKLLPSLFGHGYEGPCTLVEENFACFEDNMTATLEREFGPPFMETLSKHASGLGFKAACAVKNAHVVAKTVSDLEAAGHKSPTLEKMMEMMTDLAPRQAGGAAGGRGGDGTAPVAAPESTGAPPAAPARRASSAARATAKSSTTLKAPPVTAGSTRARPSPGATAALRGSRLASAVGGARAAGASDAARAAGPPHAPPGRPLPSPRGSGAGGMPQ